MKNHERTPSPYLIGTCSDNSVDVAGLHIGSAYTSGSVVCVKTNGGSLVVLQAVNISTGNYIDSSNTDIENDESS